MSRDYTSIVKKCLAPIIQRYDFTFAPLDGDEMFLIGNGFALYAFVNWREFYSDLWYVSLDDKGVIRTHSLMYIDKERMTQADRDQYLTVDGMPKNFDDKVSATFSIICIGYLNHCHDILSGDTKWLQNYPDQGAYSRHVARFLKPYFESRGYYVAPVPDSYNS